MKFSLLHKISECYTSINNDDDEYRYYYANEDN